MDEIGDIQVQEEERWSFDKEQNIRDMEEDSEDDVKGEDENLVESSDKTSKCLHECK